MTIYYVASDGDNTTGLSWSTAFTTIGGTTTYAAGDVVYVDKTFQETVSADLPGADGNNELPVKFYCVDRTGDPEPPDETDYSPQTTQYNFTHASKLTENHNSLWHGFYFKATDVDAQEDNNKGGPISFYDCIFEMGIDGHFEPMAEKGMRIVNCTFKGEGSSSDNLSRLEFQSLSRAGEVQFIDCDFTDSTNAYCVALFYFPNRSQRLILRNCDFSTFGSSAAGVGIAPTGDISCQITFSGCKLPTNNWTYTSCNDSATGRVEFLGCDDGSDQETDTIRAYNGDLDTWGAGIASRAVYRTNGFTRKDQTNPQCWRIDSTNKMDYGSPFRLFPISVYNDTTGSTRKITVEYLLGDASATDDLDYTEMWLEISYYAATGVLLTVEDNRESPDLEATPTAHATSTEAWTTTDAESQTAKRKMEITTTSSVAQEGIIMVNIYVASIGTNDSVYVCPKATIS